MGVTACFASASGASRLPAGAS